MQSGKTQFIKLILHRFKFRMFLFSKLPGAFFSGIAVKEFDAEKAIVTIPYKWFTQNPFGSTYFACLAMAAEMSTGLLAMMCTYKSNPPISMLVTGLEASYFKKAIGVTTFTCLQGMIIYQCIAEAIKTGNGTSIKVTSTGKNNAGEIVAIFNITWSFKVKKSSDN